MNDRKNSTLEILGMLAALFLVLSALSFFVQGAESTLLILRFGSIFGLLFSAAGLVLIARIPKQSVNVNTNPRIEPVIKSMFVEIHDQSIMHTTPVIDLENLDDLIRLAKWHGMTVLHLTLNFIHLYYVRGMDNVTYRFVLTVGEEGIRENTVADVSLEDTQPNRIPGQDPYRVIHDYKEHTRSVIPCEDDSIPPPENREEWDYIISVARIEFSEPNF